MSLQHQEKSFNLLAPEFPNRTILNTSRHSSNGLQLERKLPYLPTTCSVSPPLSTHGKLKVKTGKQRAHDCLTNQSCEGESDLIALPAIPAKLRSLPAAGKEPQHLPLPERLSLGTYFWEAWRRLQDFKLNRDEASAPSELGPQCCRC